MLEETENWLYEDGEDQPKQVYEEKLDALKVCFVLLQRKFQFQKPFSPIRKMENGITFNVNINFQRLGQPIQDRHREQEDRPRAFEELGKKLQIYMKFLDAFKQKVNPFDLGMQWGLLIFFKKCLKGRFKYIFTLFLKALQFVGFVDIQVLLIPILLFWIFRYSFSNIFVSNCFPG